MEEKSYNILIIIFIIAFLGGMITWEFVSSYYESETYNRLTGAKTTMFDALWVELRAQEGVKDK